VVGDEVELDAALVEGDDVVVGRTVDVVVGDEVEGDVVVS
jgi:hypothetical protein